MANVLEMVGGWLREYGYDGLFNAGECACLLGDLAPCDQILNDCEAGYRVEGCTGNCASPGDCDWHVQREAPASTPSSVGGGGR